MTAYQPSYVPGYDDPYQQPGYGDYAGTGPLPLEYGSPLSAADAVAKTGVFLPFIAGLVWGMGTGFSYLTPMPAAAMFGALVAAAIVFSFINPGWMTGWFTTLVGVLLTAHVAVAGMSGMTNGSHPMAMFRYLLVLPALCLMIGAVRHGPRTVTAVRAGLMVSGLAFVAYHLAFADLNEIANPYYRLRLFLNPNGVGFIAAMTAVCCLDFALGSIGRHERAQRDLTQKTASALVRGFLGFCVLPCLILCVFTKSRTASGVCVAGLLVRLYMSLGFRKTLAIAVIGGLAGATVAAGLVSDFWEKLSEVFQFNDRLRGISGGTGRFRAWSVIYDTIFVPNWVMGVGPGQTNELTGRYASAGNAHNAVLQYMCETGLLGTLPIVGIIGVGCWYVLRKFKAPRAKVAIALFIAGCLEAMFETMFISLGNPGSLMFMLALASLCIKSPGETSRGEQPAAAAAASYPPAGAEEGSGGGGEDPAYWAAGANGNGNGHAYHY